MYKLDGKGKLICDLMEFDEFYSDFREKNRQYYNYLPENAANVLIANDAINEILKELQNKGIIEVKNEKLD